MAIPQARLNIKNHISCFRGQVREGGSMLSDTWHEINSRDSDVLLTQKQKPPFKKKKKKCEIHSNLAAEHHVCSLLHNWVVGW